MIVEDAEGGDCDNDYEDWETSCPDAPGSGDGGERAIGAAAHEGPRIGSGSGDEGAVGREPDMFERRGMLVQAEWLVEDRALPVT